MWRCCRRQPWSRRESPLAAAASYSPLPCRHLQRSSYVNAKTKWKKDASLDGIEVVNRSPDIRVLSSLKNTMMASPAPAHAIPVSAVSKMDRILEIPTKVAVFLRRYPSFYEEFVGPHHNLPWIKTTREAVAMHGEEEAVFEVRRGEIVDGVRRLVLMSTEEYSEGKLRVVEMGNGVMGLAAMDCGQKVLSALQRNAMKKMGEFGGTEPPSPSMIEFSLFPSKGFRLKQKVTLATPTMKPDGRTASTTAVDPTLSQPSHPTATSTIDRGARRRRR